MKIGDTVKIVNEGQLYPNYESMAKALKATKWREDASIRDGQRGIVKKIWREEGAIYVLVDVGDFEIVMSGLGLAVVNPRKKSKARKKTPKKRKKIVIPTIKIAASVYNGLCRALKNFKKRPKRKDSDNFPYCYLLGKNKNGIFTKMARLKRAGFNGATGDDECFRMINISPSVIAQVSIKLYKENTIPCGIARVGDFHLWEQFGDRGMSLAEVGGMGGFILSMTAEDKGDMKIEQYINRSVKTLKYKIVMSGAKKEK